MTVDSISRRFWRRGLTTAERRHLFLKAPAWARRFEAAYAEGRQPLPWPSGLLNAILPLVDDPRHGVRAALANSAVTPAGSDERAGLVETLERALFNRLFAACSRTLVLELGAASERQLLSGDSPEDRYRFFCDCLTDVRFSYGVLGQYPALVRRLASIGTLWETATLETLARLTADQDLLRQGMFGGEDPGPWIGTEPLGDYHRGGRAVHRLDFASGARLIYKPRPVAMETGFLELTAWLNEAGLNPDLRAVEVFDRGSYGWARYIKNASCGDAGGVDRFFRRQGANLALAYLLGAVDLHFENVIAAGEYPVIVDLEALFETTSPPAGMGGASAAASEVLNDSVMRTLLLPVRIRGDADANGARASADVSALGYVGDEEAIYFASGWEGKGSDAMRMAKVRATMPAATCLPEFDGRRIPAADHVEEIVGGFEATYELLVKRRQVLGSMETGPLGRFRGHLARRVLRPTPSYVRLLDMSWHPSLGEDAAELNSHLHERLRALTPGASPGPAIEAADAADLFLGDIPYFSSQVGKRSLVQHLVPALGRRRGTLRPNGGWEACRQRVERLSSVDQDRQVWMARLSLVTFDTPLEKPAVTARELPDPSAVETAARGIGDRLCTLAIIRRGRASWLFPTLDDRVRLSPAVVGFDLYDGLAGIALFLGALWLRTGEQRYRRVAEAALAEALAIHRSMPRERISIGAYDGAGGLAWALAVVGRWFGRTALTLQAIEIVRRHAPFAAEEPTVDLIGGRAGFLAAGIAVATMAGDSKMIEALGPCANSLGTLAPEALPDEAEAGLAHGRAGVGLALARWARLRQNDQDFDAAYGLLVGDLDAAGAVRRGERPAEREHDGRTMIAWCRGGMGVGLATIRLGRPHASGTRDLVEAIAGTLASTEGAALCPCHGALGTIEFLEAARTVGVEGSAALADRLGGEIMTRVLGGELCADHYHRIEAPGLMRGLAGTGYALLRMLDPDRFPSVLTLEFC